MESSIAVDLDGTLAHYTEFKGEDVIGDPVPTMQKRVMAWVKAGKKVKIFSARAGTAKGKSAIESWLKRNGFPALDVTNIKDYGMTMFFDDRAVHVEKNTGKIGK